MIKYQKSPKDKPAKIKKVGLVGWPVKHSLSPLLHNLCFAALQLPYHYGLYEIPPDKFDSKISGLKNELEGFNVTIPYKRKIAGRLDGVSAAASRIGAVNCASKVNGNWRGFNTDAQGFLRALKEALHPHNLSAFIVGCGGAACAVAFALMKSGIKKLYLNDIDTPRAMALRTRILKFFPEIPVFAAPDFAVLKHCDILVNATPVGMEKDEMSVPGKFLHKRLYVFDCIYNRETPLLKYAKKRNMKFQNGLNMLIYQAAESFKIWTGIEPPVEVMKKALEEK
ncbi:MAG: shikimate dehydrogenase [bacterium]